MCLAACTLINTTPEMLGMHCNDNQAKAIRYGEEDSGKEGGKLELGEKSEWCAGGCDGGGVGGGRGNTSAGLDEADLHKINATYWKCEAK